MTRQDFYSYKERSLNKFCYKVVNNESSNAMLSKRRKIRDEVNFSALPVSVQDRLATSDSYDIGSRVFYVLGAIPVMVIDEVLAQALSLLVNPYREVILLYYFLDLSFARISLLLDVPYTTVEYRYAAAMKRLKDIIRSL